MPPPPKRPPLPPPLSGEGEWEVMQGPPPTPKSRRIYYDPEIPGWCTPDFSPAPLGPLVAKSIGELSPPVKGDDSNELIRDRFLCRGGGLILAAPAGIGKSTFGLQAMLCFGAGLSCFGFVPSRPLHSLYIQAENDDGDLAELRDGILAGLRFTKDQRKAALANVYFITVDNLCGKEFIEKGVEPLCETHKPDLLWIDPLFAYIGGDVSSQAVVSPWLRNHLNPVLHHHNVGCVLVHHVNKPPSNSATRPNWQAGDFAYLGSGSAELANWPRAVVAIRSIGNHTVFELVLGKRGARAKWKNPDGSPAFSRYIAHGVNGIYWRDADPAECPVRKGKEPVGRPEEYNPDTLLAVLPAEGLRSGEWQKAAKLPGKTFHNKRRALLEAGRVEKDKATGCYKPTGKP